MTFSTPDRRSPNDHEADLQRAVDEAIVAKIEAEDQELDEMSGQ